MPKSARKRHVAKRSHRRPDGTFRKREATGTGPLPRGTGESGRSQALRILDDVIRQNPVQQALYNALMAEALKRPRRFWKEIVAPLIPKEALVRLESAERMPVRILLDDAEEAVSNETAEKQTRGEVLDRQEAAQIDRPGPSNNVGRSA